MNHWTVPLEWNGRFKFVVVVIVIVMLLLVFCFVFLVWLLSESVTRA